MTKTRNFISGALCLALVIGIAGQANAAPCITKTWGAVADNDRVVAFKEEKVPFGGKCEMQSRVCENGKLSGTYEFRNCTVEPPKGCEDLAWGKLKHGDTRQSFLINFGQGENSCAKNAITSRCNNGIIENDAGDKDYKFRACVDTPKPACESPCGLIKSGEGCMAFKGCDKYEWRECESGKLSGTYTQAEPECKNCALPWGGRIDHGSVRTTYKSFFVKDPKDCRKSKVSCDDGNLQGKSYSYPRCVLGDPANNPSLSYVNEEQPAQQDQKDGK